MGRVAAFRPVKRTSSDRAGRRYQTPDGDFPSVTTVLSVVGKPALLNWMAAKEREYVIEAAANLWEDAPLPKMSRLAFIATLQQRLTKEKAGERERNKAADIGSQTHAMVECYLRRELGQLVDEPRLSPEAAFAFSQFLGWKDRVKLEPIWMEHTVWSKIYGYAGTLDLTCRLTIPEDREEVKRAFSLPNDMSLEAFYQEHRGQQVLVLGDIKTSKRVYMEARLQCAAYAAAHQEMGHERYDMGLVIRLPKTADDPPFEAVPILNMDAEFAVFLHVMELWKRQREYDIASGWIKEEAGA